MKIRLNRTQQNILIAVASVLALGLIASLAYIAGREWGGDDTVGYGRMGMTSKSGTYGMYDMMDDNTDVPATSDADIARLTYLIEEEKLAHDVYTKLYEKYGVRIFSNIARSETTHQDRILDLFNTRGLDDPRSSKVGVFNDADLQKLYNDLIAQGYKSLDEAYKVGVAIEEKDIADLEADLDKVDADQTDIIYALDALLHGSRNHLQAFNRQIG